MVGLEPFQTGIKELRILIRLYDYEGIGVEGRLGSLLGETML